MMRTATLVIAFASVLACGAWRAHAGASSPAPAATANAPRLPPAPPTTTTLPAGGARRL